MKWEAISLYPFSQFHPLHRHLDISWIIASESSPLRIAHSRNRAGNRTRSLEFTLSRFALVAAVVRRMLKTRVTLGNISRVLLNLIKILIFVMIEDSSSLPMFMQLTFILSL